MKNTTRFMVRADDTTQLVQLDMDQVIEGHDRLGYGQSVMAGEPVQEYRVDAMPYMEWIADPADPERTHIIYCDGSARVGTATRTG